MQAGQDAQVLLRPSQVPFAEFGGFQAHVNIAVEGEHGLLGIAPVEGFAPSGVAVIVELGEARADAHEVRQVLGRQFAQFADQFRGIVQERRRGVFPGRCPAVEVERFGR